MMYINIKYIGLRVFKKNYNEYFRTKHFLFFNPK